MEICQRALGTGHNTTVIEPLHGKFLLHQEEGWETMTSTGLSTSKQMDKEESQCVAPYPIGD
jgi:hypothetical protein